MPQNNAIAQQELSKVYDRINSVESKVDETNGYLQRAVGLPRAGARGPRRGGLRGNVYPAARQFSETAGKGRT